MNKPLETKEAEQAQAAPQDVVTDSAAQLPAIAQPKSRAGKEIMALPMGSEVVAVAPKNLEEVFRYAQLVVGAGLAPDSYDADPQKIAIGILAGAELGVPPMQALKGIAIINRRPCIWGDLALALIQSKGVVANTEQNYTGDPTGDDFTANYVIWRKGQENPYEGHFSVKDAKRAGLWNNTKKRPWIEYPQRMLMMRARAFALRDGFADCLSGLAIAEEVRDLPEAPQEVKTDFLNDEVAETKPAETAAA